MTSPETLRETSLRSLKLKAQGKVRDIYEIDDEHLLIVATDRISAFDVVLPDAIPGKGRVLTAVSNFWLEHTADLIPNHLSGMTLCDAIPSDPEERDSISGRAVAVRKFSPLPVEAIVRGYLIGSGWKDYQRSGTICGIPLPKGLRQAERLPEEIFTPSTKAEAGGHDENISFDRTIELLGVELAEEVRKASLALYARAVKYARRRGILIADSKFEFGLDNRGRLHLIDEVLTPDSSRFWPVDQYAVGVSPPSFDKQYVRDYLETLDWDKKPPGPHLPAEVIRRTAEKYREAEQRLIAEP
ncbi:MAG: phosphoribosylaminoimidazolesuccinocarboxamide synthase [Methylococcaceae bacterium]|nr:phosphoribosylaminoimidazolesuccinocarboxamide synthase [Methylococcaceae bacterium]MCI0668682.1 phosphoribosylaminoimidazolesuccinocarboxamide synthase [Methylococcaceae bacterium]MCI0733445.1 phosphoribosylaminoimidazolesuccinocarboxamide synthase [Methylococcaceae bacterium]